MNVLRYKTFQISIADEFMQTPQLTKKTAADCSPSEPMNLRDELTWPTLIEDHDAWLSDSTSVTLPVEVDEHTYILATDADMEFSAQSVRSLLDLCEADLRVGGSCGRTHPQGYRTNPLVWYQKFEYAKGANS